MKDALAQQPVTRSMVVLLIVLLTLLVLPHVANLSGWILGFFLASIVLRLAALRLPRLLPGRWLLGLLMLLGIGNVVINTGVVDGRLAGTALLVVMLGLKLLELKNRRDMYVCVFLGFFVVMTQFLYSTRLWLAIYLLISTGLLSTLLVALNRVHVDVRQTFAATALLLLASLPVAITLFLVFPRLDTPLWAVTLDADKAVTGISDTLRMGSIGQLSQSSATAFRVRFSDKEPTAEQRYWRGMVLWSFDGKTWSAVPTAVPPRRLSVVPESRIDYELTMEATGQPWLFPLEMTAEEPDGTRFNRDYQLISRGEINKRTSYTLTAYTRFKAGDLSQRQTELALQLPEEISERTRELALGWKQAATITGEQAIVERALQYFNQQPFVYTLTPGQLGEDPVDQFLFDSRRGFCEHYASAFAVLMRLAGIPSRIVIGYQGGEFNPRAGHWIVRQSDAHAWNEVWLEGRGWVRVDPTAAVAPERIEQSIDAGQSSASGRVVYALDDKGLFSKLWQEASWLVDAADLGWHRWVLGFSKARQTSLLQRFGIADLPAWAQSILVIAVVFMLMLLAYLFGLIRKPQRSDEALQLWNRLLQRLRAQGLNVPAWFGPQQTLQAAVRKWPRQREALEYLVRLYIQLRYAQRPQAQSARRFREGLRQLQLK